MINLLQKSYPNFIFSIIFIYCSFVMKIGIGVDFRTVFRQKKQQKKEILKNEGNQVLKSSKVRFGDLGCKA